MNKKLGRNDPCWCKSGKKYKQCHMQSDQKDGGQKSFTPTGKRKFKAKVINMGGKSQSVFTQATTKPPKEDLTFDKTTLDYQVKAKKGGKPLFSKKEDQTQDPTPSEKPSKPGKDFIPTSKDWRKKEE